MKFTKMHGTGNDFVVIDCMGPDGIAIADEAASRAVELCNRNFGIGADGIILVLPGKEAAFRMRMYNPDGSEAEMCGNGIRCFAKYVVDRGLSNGALSVPVETGAGTLVVNAIEGADGKVTSVKVDMGEPVLVPSRVPTTLGVDPEPVINQPLDLGEVTLRFTTVSMGNPHAVTFVDNVKEFPVEKIGPIVEKHQVFPRRTNTEFIEVLNDHEVNFRVWERGAAETLACGTGACASAVACALNQRTGRNVLVHLPGGDLYIEWAVADNHVYMTGPAVEVFEGDI
jgi:diaminopimelate epimerase